MNDAEFVFNQTNRERKINGRGDYHKKRRGGKVVRFPSDSLSRKEKRALNGEPVTYSFAAPLEWEQFKGMPKDVQQMYIDTLAEKFKDLPGALVAESLGVGGSTFYSYCYKHGVDFNKSGKRTKAEVFLETEDGKAWVKWHEVYRKDRSAVDEEPVVEEVVEDFGEEVVEEIDEEPVKAGDISRVAELIASLAGTGAKLTIEIVL